MLLAKLVFMVSTKQAQFSFAKKERKKAVSRKDYLNKLAMMCVDRFYRNLNDLKGNE